MAARTALVITVLMSAGWPLRATAIEVHDRIITIPAGTPLDLALVSGVSSKMNTVEDPVNAKLRRSVVVAGVPVVLAGATVDGYVFEASRSGRLRGRARVGIRFTSLRAIDGRHSIHTAAISQQARGTTAKDARLVGIRTGTGTVIGALIAGVHGAAIGTAVGAVGAGAVTLATRGEDLSLDAGSTVVTRLMAPVTIRVRVP
jgi:hypothetical protein